MPRPTKAKKPVISNRSGTVPRTAVTASAHRYLGKVPKIYFPSKEWQQRAYHHYGNCGEARFAARYFGHALSRAVLKIADRSGKEVNNSNAQASLDALFAGQDGQEEMLDLVGTHLTVAGECYIVGRTVDGVDVWEVLSVTEVEGSAAAWYIKAPDSEAMIRLSDTDVVIRIWVPRPDRRWEADSPFRSLLPVLDEIEWLSRYIHAQATSRLAGNGILFLPEGTSFPPPPPGADGKEVELQNEAHGFMLTLGEAMLEPLDKPDSPEAVVPIIATVPAEAIGDIQHMTFWTQLDENVREMRQDAIHRFALGMDLPPEMVLGMGSNEGTGGGRSNGVSHWGAWMLEEQTIKLHIEPMLDMLCAALTTSYLRPATGDSTLRIIADTTRLRLRPDRSAESLELLDRGLLKAETAIKENGFQPEDMPNDEERKQWLLMKIAGGSATPEQVNAALKMLGVDLGVVSDDTETRETRPDPSMEDHPVRPKTPEPSSNSAYEVLVLRALERAGNRMRNRTQSRPPGRAYEVHTHLQVNGSSAKYLEDVWDMAEVVLADHPDAPKVIASLDSYCKMLMANQEPHSRERLDSWCQEAGL